jgi:parallel beta-helix repeat protein
MAQQLFSNNASTTLNGAITNSATSLSVSSTTNFPVISTAGNYFYMTITDNISNWEVVQVTATSGLTFTVVRGQDNTTALAWANGAIIEVRPVAQGLRDIVSNSVSYTDLISSAAGLAASTTISQGQGLVGFNSTLSYPLGTLPGDLSDTTNIINGDALIGVKQSFQGAVASTQHQINQSIASIFSFMSVGQYTSWLASPSTYDLTSIVQTAHATNPGIAIHLPGGTYLMGSITVVGNICFVGDGIAYTNVVFKSGSTGQLFNSQTGDFLIEAYGITFNGNGANQSQFNTGFIANAYGSITLDRCSMTNFYGHCIASGNSEYGALPFNINTYAHDVMVTNCVISQGDATTDYGDCFRIFRTQRFLASHNTVSGGSSGIRTQDYCSFLRIHHNDVSNSYADVGITVALSTDIEIIGNICSGNASNGIEIDSVRRCVCSGNTAHANGFCGIFVMAYVPPVGLYTYAATAMVIGESYSIATIGTTNFVACGATSNTVGLVFTCTAVGSGSGTATTANFYGIYDHVDIWNAVMIQGTTPPASFASQDLVISDNVISNNAKFGLQIGSINGGIVKGNIFRNNNRMDFTGSVSGTTLTLTSNTGVAIVGSSLVINAVPVASINTLLLGKMGQIGSTYSLSTTVTTYSGQMIAYNGSVGTGSVPTYAGVYLLSDIALADFVTITGNRFENSGYQFNSILRAAAQNTFYTYIGGNTHIGGYLHTNGAPAPGGKNAMSDPFIMNPASTVTVPTNQATVEDLFAKQGSVSQISPGINPVYSITLVPRYGQKLIHVRMRTPDTMPSVTVSVIGTLNGTYVATVMSSTVYPLTGNWYDLLVLVSANFGETNAINGFQVQITGGASGHCNIEQINCWLPCE